MQVFESRATAPTWLCPHCGKPLKASGVGGAEGELVTIKPLGPADRVERDDLVVFRDVGRGQWHVKRVVGLPGERLAIHHGDVAINGQVIRKSVWRFLQSATLLAVWQPESPATDRWHCLDGQGAGLSYRHRSPWPRKASDYPVQPSAITDEDWRDADQSWPSVTVSDLGMVMEFSDLSAGFSLEVAGYHPVDPWQVKLHRKENGDWQVAAGSSESAQGQRSHARDLKVGPSTFVRIVVGHVDSAVRVGIEGVEEQMWPWPLPKVSQIGDSEDQWEGAAVSAIQPLQVRWSMGAGQLSKAWVVRDIHYRGPHGEVTWETHVPVSHLFLLGDHPSGSLDSRQQGPHRIEAKSVFRRVEAPCSWMERLELQETDQGSRKIEVFP